MKLYFVKLKGYQPLASAYVIAENETEAVAKVRESLLYELFNKHRELDTLTLLAEEGKYPDCNCVLYL